MRPFTRPASIHKMRDSLSPGRGRHHFSRGSSFKAALFSMASAKSRFSRACYSVLSRRVSQGLISPNFASFIDAGIAHNMLTAQIGDRTYEHESRPSEWPRSAGFLANANSLKLAGASPASYCLILLKLNILTNLCVNLIFAAELIIQKSWLGAVWMFWVVLGIISGIFILFLGMSLYASALIAKPLSERGKDYVGEDDCGSRVAARTIKDGN
jgi:hypothetical protein